MKALAVLAMISLAVALGVGAAATEERNARLSDPAAPDAGSQLRGGALQEDVAAPLPPASSSYFSDIEIEGIRATVRGQLKALSARDAGGAFAYLAPGARDYYGRPEAFLSALAQQLTPLVQAQRFALAETERDSTDAVQVVLLTGADGRRWIGRFTVERQPDGQWAIKRCLVERASGQGV